MERFLFTLILVSCSCVNKTEFPPGKGIENGLLPNVQGPELPACIHVTDYRIDVWEAENYWNSVIDGCFACTDDTGMEIFVDVGDVVSEFDAIGIANYRPNGSGWIYRCDIFMAPNWEHMWSSILTHEIGHCMGLANDFHTGYLMDTFLHPLNTELSPQDLEIVRGYE